MNQKNILVAIFLRASLADSMETIISDANGNKYDLVELLERVNKQVLPEVYIIDMKEEYKKTYTIF